MGKRKKNTLREVHKKLRFLGVCSCKSRQILEGYKLKLFKTVNIPLCIINHFRKNCNNQINKKGRLQKLHFRQEIMSVYECHKAKG